jgi:hypothetical protein
MRPRPVRESGAVALMVEKLLHNYFLIGGLVILVGYLWAFKKLYKRTRITETLILLAVLLAGLILFFIGLARLDIP